MRKLLIPLLVWASVAFVAEAALTQRLAGQGSAEMKTSLMWSSREDSLREAGLTERLNDLEKVLADNERKAENWWKTWTALYGVATVGQGAVAVVSKDRSTREDMILGAGTTIMGVASQLLTPVSSGFQAIGPDSMAKLSFSAKRMLLEKEEAFLKRQMEIATAGKSWQTHALSGAVNVASGLITWLGFKRSLGEGLLNFALNTVVTEAQIWTQPVRAKQQYQSVLRTLNEEGCQTKSVRSPEWYGQAGPGGIRMGLRF